MGLDQYAGFRDEEGNVKEEFYWRKHARLQQFMSKEFNEQNKKHGDHSPDKKHNTANDLQHLGFNGGQGGVKITNDLINLTLIYGITEHFDQDIINFYFNSTHKF